MPAHVAARKVELAARDVLLFARACHQVVDQHQQAPRLRSQIESGTQHFVDQVLGKLDILLGLDLFGRLAVASRS